LQFAYLTRVAVSALVGANCLR